MAIEKLPFNTLLQSLGATHHWPMSSDTPFVDEVLGGRRTPLAIHDRDATNNNDVVAQYAPLIGNSEILYPSQAGDNNHLEIKNIAQHASLSGHSDYSFVFTMTLISDNVFEWFVVNIGGTEYIGGTPGEGSIYAVTFDSAAGEFRTYADGALRDTVAGAAGDLGLVQAFTYGAHSVAFGHFALFDRALTADDITQLQENRRFLAKVSGTASVDGGGAEASIRAFTRTGGDLAGKTTAAADGSYGLWLTEPDECDLIATPPAGVDARPMAHGPITPINQN